MLIFSLCFRGIANTSSVFAGKAAGQGCAAILERTRRLTLHWSLAALLGMTLIYALGHTPLLRLFTDLPEVLAAAERYADWGICFPGMRGPGPDLLRPVHGQQPDPPQVFLSTLQALVAFGLAWLAFVPFWGNHGLWGAYLIFMPAGRSSCCATGPRLRDAPFFRHGGAAPLLNLILTETYMNFHQASRAEAAPGQKTIALLRDRDLSLPVTTIHGNRPGRACCLPPAYTDANIAAYRQP